MSRFNTLNICLLIATTLSLSLTCAWGATQNKVSCPPDGDHYIIDVKQLTLEYKGDTLQVTLGGLAVLGGRLKVEPKTLQTAAAATQQWNEFLKGLATGYNSCAITKAQYQEGLKRICPQLFKDGDELEKLRKAFLEGRKLDEKRLQKLLEGYLSKLKKFASLSDQDIVVDRISAVVEITIKSTEEKILTAQSESEKRIIESQSTNQEVILKELEGIKHRMQETPLATPSEVQNEISTVRQSLQAKADEAETAYNEGYRLFDGYRFAEAIPHFRKALSLVKLADFYTALGRCYRELPDLLQAEKVLTEGIEFAAASRDERNETILANLLGGTLRVKGDLDGALRYAERALKIDEKIYGPDHQNVARDANNIGTILLAKGDLDWALRYAERALKIAENVYGIDHPHVAIGANNIGMVLQAKGDLDGALRYTERALKIDEKVYGPDHPNVARDANNIGQILMDKRDLDGALRYTERALKIDKKVYGPDHPNVAIEINNIGLILKAKGDLDGALRYAEHALKIDEKVYDPIHPDVARNANNIGTTLQAKGDLDGALRYTERALKIAEKIYGPDHPDVARYINNIGLIFKAKGDLDGSIRYTERALKIFEKLYGTNNPQTKIVRDNYEALKKAQK